VFAIAPTAVLKQAMVVDGIGWHWMALDGIGRYWKVLIRPFHDDPSIGDRFK
jgi:hypothetical protein